MSFVNNVQVADGVREVVLKAGDIRARADQRGGGYGDPYDRTRNRF